jgi:hypothetical protein
MDFEYLHHNQYILLPHDAVCDHVLLAFSSHCGIQILALVDSGALKPPNLFVYTLASRTSPLHPADAVFHLFQELLYASKQLFTPAFSLPYNMLSLMEISAGTSNSCKQALGGVCERLGGVCES